ncbi:VTT domain-containing protein [Mucilaginibacter sp. L3T2-6]|uniref:VTT domain-containing protein n=1 Tax=Mucilaginibacter sp. L3T2-6 TaxID=3062491 RepID=UPI0026765EA1|nr:VTT domain-containing protein [Mucilaginibacter sp. L3T2-6]MDO3644647.1 VTT domain-containing protein [Mucilaginibacter sp. L3T2-6]MDV6217099.1 VTT domain-containing protein [Mucilaginibacter sp. L3T2-6]
MEIVKSLIDFILHIDKHLAGIISQYHALTYLILFAIIFAETGFVVTPFLPGDSLLFAAGALIAGGATGLNIFLLTIILIIAAFTGNTVNYLLGNYLGPKVFKENNKILKLDYYLKTKAFFDKHGGKAVIFSRFMPIIRTIAPFVAGVGKMPMGRYSLYNIIGGAGWIVLFLFAGYELGTVPFFKEHFALIGVAIILISIIPPIYAAVKTGRTRKAVE